MNKITETKPQSGIDRAILGMGVAYAVFLVWAILWKCGMPFVGGGSERAVNLLPFNGNTRWELEFNIAVFVPFGFYLAAAKHGLTFIKQILTTLLVSFAFEAIQLILAVGRSDVTDLLMNTLGGIVGIAAFYALSKLFGKHERKAALVICILLSLLELYMAVSFIMFGQLYIGGMIIRL
ncbi:MAG: VanZ family protein [Oscillospiraceae bacterium]|jgi:glycopeptide antibiotics resistance protein|nr:VanZ family protein [Oscillospiraceae bacterium]